MTEVMKLSWFSHQLDFAVLSVFKTLWSKIPKNNFLTNGHIEPLGLEVKTNSKRKVQKFNSNCP